MKTPFAVALAACGLSQTQAAEFFGVQPDTVKSWGAGRNRVPPGVWEQLAELFEQIEQLADVIIEAVEAIEEGGEVELWVELPGRLPGNAELMAVARAQMTLGSRPRLHPAQAGETNPRGGSAEEIAAQLGRTIEGVRARTIKR